MSIQVENNNLLYDNQDIAIKKAEIQNIRNKSMSIMRDYMKKFNSEQSELNEYIETYKTQMA